MTFIPIPSRPAIPRFPFFAESRNTMTGGVDLSGRQMVSDRLTLKGKLFYHNHVDDYASYSDIDHTVLIATSRYEDYMAGGMVMADLKASDRDPCASGVALQGRFAQGKWAMSTCPLAESFSDTGSLGLENEYFMTGQFSVVVGASYDWMDVTKAKSNVIDGAGQFRAPGRWNHAGGQGVVQPHDRRQLVCFRHPSRFWLGGPKDPVSGPSRTLLGDVGQPEPGCRERSINYTLGLSKTIAVGMEFEIAGFYHDISDRIERFDKNSLYLNSEKIHVYGVEAAASWTPVDDLTLKMDWTVTEARGQGGQPGHRRCGGRA